MEFRCLPPKNADQKHSVLNGEGLRAHPGERPHFGETVDFPQRLDNELVDSSKLLRIHQREQSRRPGRAKSVDRLCRVQPGTNVFGVQGQEAACERRRRPSRGSGVHQNRSGKSVPTSSLNKGNWATVETSRMDVTRMIHLCEILGSEQEQCEIVR
jgi:hypothetical protein